MIKTTYELYVGPSPDGCSIHPHFEEGRYATPGEAQAHAEAVAGRQLIWQWMEDRRRWRAETEWGKAAEIEELSNTPVRILLDVAQL